MTHPDIIHQLIPAVDRDHWLEDVRFALGVAVAIGGALVLLSYLMHPAL